MRIELVTYQDGAMALEVIGESEMEIGLLHHAWRAMASGSPPRMGYGNSHGEKGTTGFFLPVTRDQPGDQGPRRVLDLDLRAGAEDERA